MENQITKENDWRQTLRRLCNAQVDITLAPYPIFSDAQPTGARRTMAALLSLYKKTKACETGVLIMDLLTLMRVSGLGLNNLKVTLNWLKKHGYIDYVPGVKAEDGTEGKCGKYIINFDKLN